MYLRQKAGNDILLPSWLNFVERQQAVKKQISPCQSTDNRYYDTQALRLRRGIPPPDVATIRDFVRFHASVAEGRIDDNGRITTETVNTTLEHFFAGFSRITGSDISGEFRSEIYNVSTLPCQPYVSGD